MNRQSLLRASILCLSLSAAAASAQEPTTEKPKAAASAKKAEKGISTQGKFKWSGAKGEKAAVRKQIDDILYTLEENIRVMAEERLSKKLHIPEWIDIKQKGGKITINAEGRNPEVYSLEGPTDGLDPEGNPSELRLTKGEGGSFTQQVTTAEGKRVNVYYPQADGGLKVDCELSGPRLAKPVKYTLTYGKASK